MIEDKPGTGLGSSVRKTNMDYSHVNIKSLNPFTDNPFDSDHVNVWHCCWKSFKKIGFIHDSRSRNR